MTMNERAASRLRERIEGILRLAEEGHLAQARDATEGDLWLSFVDPGGVPSAILDDAQGWIDLAHYSLEPGRMDADAALDALRRARSVLSR